MNGIDCEVVRDLLPLYIDGACSSRSAALVASHLDTCPECRKLLTEMRLPLEGEKLAPGLRDRALFRGVLRSIFGIIIAAAVMLSCFIMNVGGAWMGGPAGAGQLAATFLYCIFWGVFTVASRNFRPLIRFSFVISFLTFLSAFGSLICVLLETGGFIAAFLSVFASVPFYGLRYFLPWEGVYAAGTVVALIWLVYACTRLRGLHRFLQTER